MLISSWFTHLSHRWTAASSASLAAPVTGVAGGLLRDAQAMAGVDPHEAERLRSAARTYLSVIR